LPPLQLGVLSIGLEIRFGNPPAGLLNPLSNATIWESPEIIKTFDFRGSNSAILSPMEALYLNDAQVLPYQGMELIIKTLAIDEVILA
jgi:hypothetical protein